MADNIAITPGSGATYGADELTDGTLGSIKVGFTKIMDGTLDSSNKLVVTAGGAAKVDGSAATQPISVSTVGHGTAAAAIRVELPTDGTGVVNAAQSGTWSNTVTQGTATNLKAQAENYQGGTAVGSGNPLQVTLANTGSNATAVKVDGSAATQPVSGTVAVSSITTAIVPGIGATNLGKAEDAAHASGDVGVQALSVRKDTAAATSGTDGDYQPLITDSSGKLYTKDAQLGWASADYDPQYSRTDLGNTSANGLNPGGGPNVDPFGSLQTRGAVLTDEGSTRINFTGSALTRSFGSAITFTNGSPIVSGTGFTGIDLHQSAAIKLGADGESAYGTLGLVLSDSLLLLTAAYTGTGGTGAMTISPIATVTGTGASFAVGSGQMTLALGTNTSATSYGYAYVFRGAAQISGSFSISQRVANQDIYFGLESSPKTTITQFARFHFSGTSATTVVTETGYNPTTTPSASETESNTITIPNAGTSASQLTYKIEYSMDAVTFSINNVIVATHTKRIPPVFNTPPSGYYIAFRGLNSGAVTNTNIVSDYFLGKTYNRLETTQTSPGTLANQQIVSQTSATDTSAATQTITAADSATSSTAQQSGQNAVTGTPTTNSAATFAVGGIETANVLITGTWSATLTIEVSFDGGTTYFLRGIRLDGTNVTSSAPTSNASGSMNTAGVTNIRVRATAYTSGTVSVRLVGSVNPATQYLANPGSLGAATTAATAPTIAAEQGYIGVTALPTAVTTGQLVGGMADIYGRQVVVSTAPRDLISQNVITLTSSTAETTLLAAVASTKLDLTYLKFTNSSATGTLVTVRDATAGTAVDFWYVPAGQTVGGVLGVPFKQTTANNNWTVQCTTSVASVYVTVQAAQNK